MKKEIFSVFLIAVFACLLPTQKGFGNETCQCGSTYSISFLGEYLYWTSPQRELEFARIVDQGPLDFPGIAFGTDKIHQVNYKWNSGFRAGVGFQNPCSFFRPKIAYTRFHTKGSGSASAAISSGGSAFQGLPSFPPTLPPASQLDYPAGGLATIQHARSKAKLYMDYIDFSFVGMNYCCGSFLWDWDFGVRGSILQSKWKTDYLVILNSGIGPQDVKINWKYSGLGILLDGDGRFEMGAGFSIYETLTGALLLGNLHTSCKAFIIPPDVGTVGICDVHQSHYRIVPVIQSETGIAWKCSDCENDLNLQINVAFEYMKWCSAGENKYYSIPEGGPYKRSEVDVDTFGLTAGLTLYF